MSPKPTVRAAAGTRDFLPEEMALRTWVRDVIESSFQTFGFLPLETPALERLEVLTGKYGEEADRLVFKILKRGAELERGMQKGELCDLALRYDLTVPLSRVIAMNQGQLIFPFKRYQIQPVWRAERQQKGRYREFMQCDADIVGTTSPSADAEIIALTDHILQKLQIPGYRIHINHRGLLKHLILRAGIPEDKFIDATVTVDKADKIGWDGVREELAQKGYSAEVIARLIDSIQLAGRPADVIRELQSQVGDLPALAEFNQLYLDLLTQGVEEDRLSYTTYLARGLDYYTGPIFETIVEKPKIGSITGGGRYDNLIGMFASQQIPATGTTIGIERIFDVIRELHLFHTGDESPVKVLVAVFSEATRSYALGLAAELRKAGIPTDVYHDKAKKLGKQFAYADKRNIPYVVIAGPDEIDQNAVTLKDLKRGEQMTVSRNDLLQQIE